MTQTNDDDGRAALGRVLVDADAAARGPLAAQVDWLRAASRAVRDAELGDDGARAALDLDAAIGAVVAWSRGDRSDDTLVELQALMQALLTRALATIATATAGAWREVATDEDQRIAATEMAAILDDVARALQSGLGVPSSTAARIEAVRRGQPPHP